VNSLSFNQAA